MKNHRTGFYKGIPSFTVSSDDLLLEAAEASIYRWWWEFLRLSPVYWYARKTGKRIAISELARAYEIAGNLATPIFGMWWERHGKYAFEEIHRPAKTRIIEIDHPREHELYQKSVIVEIPLTISRKKIMKEVKGLLDEIGHEVNALNVIRTTNAKLKLKSKKFSLSTIENEYWVLIYRILYPDLQLWKLGDRLQLAPNNHVRGRVQSDVASINRRGLGPFARLQSLTGRHYYKARFARVHAEHGNFPNYTKINALNDRLPFGAREHKEFLLATSEKNSTYSPWQNYVREKYGKSLYYEIMRRNRLDRLIIRDSVAKARFPSFVSGDIDLTT
jgi:hypothetical protein